MWYLSYEDFDTRCFLTVEKLAAFIDFDNKELFAAKIKKDFENKPKEYSIPVGDYIITRD